MGELKIFHPNAKGTGACLMMTQRKYDCVTLSIHPEKQQCGIPCFDMNDCVSFAADWCNLSEMLMVFRGECESLGDGRGLSYAYDAGWSKLMLRHVIEPVRCYVLEIYEKREDVENRGIFSLSPAEALGLSLIIEGVLHHTLIGGEP